MYQSETATLSVYRSLCKSASILAICGALAACSATSGGSSKSAGATSAFPVAAYQGSADDYVAQVAFWGSKHDLDPGDQEAAINYGRALRHIEQTQKAVTILNRAVLIDSNNPVALAEYGKVLIQSGRVAEGLDYLSRASSRKPGDWEILAAEGVGYDQLGNHNVAQRKYDEALSASPENPVVLTNKALSMALEGKIADAELLLRQAVNQPQSTPQMRQNLALVLGLQGNFAEARRYAAADLPANMVENNMTVIREMIANETSPWSELQEIE